MGESALLPAVKWNVTLRGARCGAVEERLPGREHREAGWVWPMPCNNDTVLLAANLLASGPFPCRTGRIHPCPCKREKK